MYSTTLVITPTPSNISEQEYLISVHNRIWWQAMTISKVKSRIYGQDLIVHTQIPKVDKPTKVQINWEFKYPEEHE